MTVTVSGGATMPQLIRAVQELAREVRDLKEALNPANNEPWDLTAIVADDATLTKLVTQLTETGLLK